MRSSRNLIVKIKQGKVQGTIRRNVDGGEFLAFDGIPFAQPPIGELRFKDPLPVKPEDGIVNRDRDDRTPAQYDILIQQFIGTEDCLYLNVATNSLDGKRPVMVWFHGGGFNMSSASPKLFGADYLLKQDIVFVSIGYRLACLGFLNLGLQDASGNQGMKDMVVGLNWVQENIEAFSGDPGNVTIFGESAGGVAVHLLNLSPLVKGLFHKAIIQSSVAINPWSFSQNPMKEGLHLASILSNRPIKDSAEALKILMQATTLQLLKAQTQMNPRSTIFEGVLNFIPSVDSKTYPQAFMPKPPKEMVKNGINVPLIIGSTSDEGMMCALSPQIEACFQDMNTKFAAVLVRSIGISKIKRIKNIVNIVRTFYFGETELITITKNTDGYIRFMGDVQFYIGIQQVIEIQSKLPTPTYVYQFCHRPSYPTLGSLMKCDIEGSAHGDELGALFHSSAQMGDEGLQKGTKDYLVMERLTRMWGNFAKTGNPTPKLDEKLTAKWEPITKNKINCLNIGDELVPGVNFGEASWKFWKSVFETL